MRCFTLEGQGFRQRLAAAVGAGPLLLAGNKHVKNRPAEVTSAMSQLNLEKRFLAAPRNPRCIPQTAPQAITAVKNILHSTTAGSIRGSVPLTKI